MQVRIEDVSPVEKKMIVEVPWATVDAKLRNAYKELARGVSLKGFRKGKVPRTVLQRMFGKQVQAEVASQLVRESFISAATEHKLEAVSEPIVDQELSIRRGEPFSFEAIIEVKGDVEVSDYEGMDLTVRPNEVPEAEVERALAQIQEENTELRPIEGREVTAASDVVSIKISGTIGDQEVERDSMPVDLSDPDHEPLPGLIEALTGLPLDAQEHPIELTIPEEYRDTSIAGAVCKLTVSVIDAREKDVPELDDELAKDTGRAETLDELREVVTNELKERQGKEIKSELRDAALAELVKRNQIPVASSLVDRAVEMQFNRFRMMLGIPADQGGEELGLDEEMRDKMKPKALDDVRGQLLLDAIAEKESIEVTDDDIDAYILEMASARGVPMARLRAELDAGGRLDSIRFQLRQDKTLDLLIERGTVTEKEPEPEPEPGSEPNEEGAADEAAAEPAEPASEPDEGGSKNE